MKLSICFVFVLTFYFSLFEVEAASTAKDMKAPIQCFDAPTNHYWNAGTIYNPIGQCVSLQCNNRGQRVQVTCPVISTDGCQRQPANLRKAYPLCCPTCNK